MEKTRHIHILIANQREERLGRVAAVVEGLGHEVIARTVRVEDVGALTARERPDLALVGLGESSEHALQLISEIVRGAYCPVIALLEEYDPGWVDQAAERGIYAYIVDTRPEELQSAIDITLRRFAEFEDAHGAFEKREAEHVRAAEMSVASRRRMLELHDGVVQGLVVGQLALEMNHTEQSREALLTALENARTLVGHSLEELRSEGVPLGELLGDAAPS